MKRARSTGQMSFDFADAVAFGVENIFLALKPPIGIAEVIEGRARSISRDLRLGRNLMDAGRLHVTVVGFREGRSRVAARIKWIDEMMAGFKAAALEVVLPLLSCFGGDSIVLRADRSKAVERLRQTVIGKLWGRASADAQSFEAHMTICHSHRRFSDVPVEPIPWSATELVLIRSFIGHRRHETICSWPLTAPQEIEAGAEPEAIFQKPAIPQLKLDLN